MLSDEISSAEIELAVNHQATILDRDIEGEGAVGSTTVSTNLPLVPSSFCQALASNSPYTEAHPTNDNDTRNKCSDNIQKMGVRRKTTKPGQLHPSKSTRKSTIGPRKAPRS